MKYNLCYDDSNQCTYLSLCLPARRANLARQDCHGIPFVLRDVSTNSADDMVQLTLTSPLPTEQIEKCKDFMPLEILDCILNRRHNDST